EPGVPAQYVDPNGNILDHQGNVVDSVDNAPTDVVDKPTGGNPAAGSDVPHTPSPIKEPALVGAGSHTADNAAHVGDNAGQTVRLGDSLDNNLGDVGRTGDNAGTPTVHAGDNLPGQAGHELPGGKAGDNLPGGSADHLPGGTAGDHLPGGRADDVGTGPSASHEPPSGHTGGHGDGSSGGGHGDGPNGSHDPTRPHQNDPTSHHQGNDGAHHTSGDGDGTHDHPGDHQVDNGAHHEGGHEAGTTHGHDGSPPDSLQVGDNPLPPPGAGQKLLGDLPESRVRRTEDGLISHVDGRPVTQFLDQLSQERALAYLDAKEAGTFPRGQTGACVGSVVDLRTGRVIEGINGPKGVKGLLPLDRLHPTLLERYEQIADAPPHRAPILAHAEVKAANELLWARQELGLPDDVSALREMRASVQFPFMDDLETGVSPRPAPFCGNCNHMLEGVPSSYGRYLKDPPGPENWIP
ncbi:hypothetical protein ACIRJQ_46145, partial [Streptomyces avermitilis]